MMTYDGGSYDIIVVGAGHAGCEAALAGARMGMNTLLLTINLDGIALMACNPAIGGNGQRPFSQRSRRPRRADGSHGR